MNEMEKEVFQMYRNTINGRHCRICYEMAKNEGKTLNPPISFWNLGKNFGDKSKPRVAFVGKTSWMNLDDIEALGKKIGPIHDVRGSTNYFFGEAIKWYQYWRSMKNISKKIYSIEEDSPYFLDSIFITNLVKCNIFRQDSYVNITGLEYFSNCIDIFEKEIEIAKPSHVILFTNKYYDHLINDLRFGYKDNDCEYKDITDWNYRKQVSWRRDIKYKYVCWWHRVFSKKGYSKMHFLRTRHPQGAPGEFEDAIVQWIEKWRISP